MPYIRADRVMETSTTTGTGALTLAGAVAGFRTFASVASVADTVHYVIELVNAEGAPTGEWETGLGTYSGVNTLTRTTPIASSNGGAAVNFSAGTKRVAISNIEASVVSTSGDVMTGPLTVGGDITVNSFNMRTGNNSFSFSFYSGTAFNTGGAAVALRGISAGFNNGGIEFYTGVGATGTEKVRFNASGDIQMGGANTVIDSNRLFRLRAYTVATLPAAGTAGRKAYVTDALAPSFLTTVVGGGAVVTPVFDNGTNWVAG